MVENRERIPQNRASPARKYWFFSTCKSISLAVKKSIANE
jgi:hypothetical protein